MKKLPVLPSLLAIAVLVFIGWYLPELVATRVATRPAPAQVAQQQPAAPAQTESTPALQADAQPPAEETGESADNETGLERILPRQSVAREAGLHKVKDPLRLGSSAAIVMEAATGKVLYWKNDQATLPMASLTKLMTGLLIVEAKLPLDEVITITQEDVDTERSSRSRVRVGSTMTRDEALRLALMSSENRAAHALGRTFPGGLAAFVKAMNDRARALGMESTVYVDPTGLSAGNRSTARDLAKLTTVTSTIPLLRDYSTTKDHQTVLGNRSLRYVNSNNLVRNGWDISLQKTGYIIEAGHCVAMRTDVAGREVVMVLLDAGNNRDRTVDAQRIRRWLGGADEPAAQVARKAPRKDRKVAARTEGKRVKAEFDAQKTTAAKGKKQDAKLAAATPKKGGSAAAKTKAATDVAKKKKSDTGAVADKKKGETKVAAKSEAKS